MKYACICLLNTYVRKDSPRRKVNKIKDNIMYVDFRSNYPIERHNRPRP